MLFYLCLAYGDTNMYHVTFVIEIFNHKNTKKGLHQNQIVHSNARIHNAHTLQTNT